MIQINKIITHAGKFHADEVLAIALLQIYGFNAPIERKFEVDESELEDPLVFILDVGKHYDKTLGNFDHHQDADSPATNILIANWLTEQDLISSEVRENLSEFLNYVSDVDRGLIVGGNKDYTFNGIIDSLNPGKIDGDESNKAFEVATTLAKQIIEARLKIAQKAVYDKIIWQKLERLCGGKVAISEKPDIIANRTKLAMTDGVQFFINPSTRGGWQIISSDSLLFNIPDDSRQKFRHNSGFLATYETKQDAIDHASEIVK
ncbi:MAG: MYG1 family protein [Candidatus Pacebacteria bacterium]|nr:MYG1 family protein [Candidatus Paceibacterota bacterium]